VSLSVLAQAVLVVFGLFLVGLAMVAFVKPATAKRFFTAFASSAATHYTEQAFRLLIGVSLIFHAPAMWQGGVFRIVGWTIAVTSLGLLVTPWRWHHRFGQLVMPLILRHVRLYAIGLMAFGILLLLGMYWASVPTKVPPGEHPARQSPVHRTRAQPWIPARGLLSEVPEDRRPMAGPRTVGRQCGRLVLDGLTQGLAAQWRSSLQVRVGARRRGRPQVR
jgi:hypothetical protein